MQFAFGILTHTPPWVFALLVAAHLRSPGSL